MGNDRAFQFNMHQVLLFNWDESAEQWRGCLHYGYIYGDFVDKDSHFIHVMQALFLTGTCSGRFGSRSIAEEYLDHMVNGQLVQGLKSRMDQYLTNSTVDNNSFSAGMKHN